MNRFALLATLALFSAPAFAAEPAPSAPTALQLHEIGRLHVASIGSKPDEKRLREALNKQLTAQGYKAVSPEQAQGVMTVELWRRKALNGKVSYYVNAWVTGPDASPVWNGFPGKRATEPGSAALKSVEEAAALITKRFFDDWTKSADVAEKIDAAVGESPAP